MDVVTLLSSISTRLSAIESRLGSSSTASASASVSIPDISNSNSSIPEFSGSLSSQNSSTPVSSTPSTTTSADSAEKIVMNYRGIKTGQRLVMAGNKSRRSQIVDQQTWTGKFLKNLRKLVDENGPYAARLSAAEKEKLSELLARWKGNVLPVQVANQAAGGTNNQGQYANEQQFLNAAFKEIRQMDIKDVFEVQS